MNNYELFLNYMQRLRFLQVVVVQFSNKSVLDFKRKTEFFSLKQILNILEDRFVAFN